MAAFATDKCTPSPCSRPRIIEEVSRVHELTRILQAVVLPLTPAHNQMARDLFQDILCSSRVTLSELTRPCSSHSQAKHSDQKDEYMYRDDGCKKRKRQDSETILTAIPYSDGYQWRKYGQKHIKNSKFPRSYFRCAYHKDQGCPATKTVQEIYGKDNLPMFSVTLSKQHTCQIVNTSSPVVVDSSNKSKDTSAISTLASSSRKREEDKESNIHSDSSSTNEEGINWDGMILHGPAAPVQPPPMEDVMLNILSPISIWDFGTEWTAID